MGFFCPFREFFVLNTTIEGEGHSFGCHGTLKVKAILTGVTPPVSRDIEDEGHSYGCNTSCVTWHLLIRSDPRTHEIHSIVRAMVTICINDFGVSWTGIEPLSSSNVIYSRLFSFTTDTCIIHGSSLLVLSYKYWLHERVTWGIVTPRKPMLTSIRPLLRCRFFISLIYSQVAQWDISFPDCPFAVLSSHRVLLI